ncbi:unnamed protein product [Didymodactylos carnosus]|uniref:GPI transamidase component PIG-T n=1 Tax=Didymodactylos carnosus TaxID=1234261 RepID=A0A814C5R0_9BILA|nr:unnamed protein product [Didymodactylos carnosus]CAF1332721.1 unnamed protein product [Didymodactylos carnosus]CAF3716280.1 unnamed protein product [Didymodactylos carnosus]CAF4144041.1 unnamed protein product [Didymodactylos carnosus]
MLKRISDTCFEVSAHLAVDDLWKSFVHELGGLLCASLNFVDTSTSSSSPKYSFRPQSTVTSQSQEFNNSNLRYAVLPREIVCTENLTPWKKFLPCNTMKGLSSLLVNSPKLYDINYHSLRMDFRQICADSNCLSSRLELSLGLGVVVDTFAKPGQNEWSLRSIFGQNMNGACPLSDITNVYIDLELSKLYHMTLSPLADYTIESNGRTLVVYDVNNMKQTSHGTFSLSCKHDRPSTDYWLLAENNKENNTLPYLYVHRYTTGYGARNGGIKTQIYNTPDTTTTLLYFEQIPWYFRVFLHTLKIIMENGTNIKPDRLSYIPGKDRERPYQIEMFITIPADVPSVEISFEYEMTFLKWNEFPPDPNHGFYIPAAVISTILPKLDKQQPILRQLQSFSLNESLLLSSNTESFSSSLFVRIYSESLLVNLPTPDFSMPFNVICLGCTAVALAFGGFHNLTTKQFSYVEKKEKKNFRQYLQLLWAKFLAFKQYLNAKTNRNALRQDLHRQHQHVE